MLNLTESPITLIAESGETTTIPASEYVARVETTRRKIGHAPILGQRAAKAIGVTIYEEAPLYVQRLVAEVERITCP